MLEAMRRGATSKLAALIIFIPLILAFALWGVGPEFRASGTTAVARVGKTEITPEQFQQAYQVELQQLSQQFGRRLTQEQARMFGLEQNVLSRLVGSAALDAQARDLGLTISEKTIVEETRASPAFAGFDGKFSRAAFEQFLRQNGLSEAGYFALRKREETREKLIEAVAAPAVVPQAAIDLVHRNRAEQRVLAYTVLDPAKVVKVADPDEAKLKEYYEANKRLFMTPAYRKLGLLLLTREQVKGKLVVGDDEVKAAYEQTKDTYNTPERRRVQQVAFPDKAAAEKAYDELAKAKSFVEAAAKFGAKESDLDLGNVTKAEMIDKAIAEAAFALKKDEVSKPVAGQFSTVILRVTDITPGTTKTFEDVKALVRDKLSTERALKELQTLHDKVEDERTAGRTFKEIAEKLGLVHLPIDAVDRAGNGPDSKPIAGIPDTARVMGAAFGAAQGVETDALELADGGYAWYDVLGITAEKERPFEEVKVDAKTKWLEVEKAKALGEAAAKLVERLLKGEAIEAVATDGGGKVEKTGPFTRAVTPTGLTQDVVRQGFGLPKGAASSAATADGQSRIVFRVAEVIAAGPPTDEEAKRLRDEMQRGQQADALNAYVAGLQARYGVTINQQALAQVLGLDGAASR